MQFTYTAYHNLLEALRQHQYTITDYHGKWDKGKKYAILRHDVDYSLEKACVFARLENEFGGGVKSTYFVLLTGDFYNLHSLQSQKCLEEIQSLGHEIGLHFDEKRYPDSYGNAEAVSEKIQQEVIILSRICGTPCQSVSMHRPSKDILNADLQIPGLVNSYSSTFFKEWKYVSDSRRYWREPIEEYIEKENHIRMHILTHAFWYREEEKSLSDTLRLFIEDAANDRRRIMEDNFTNLTQALEGTS